MAKKSHNFQKTAVSEGSFLQIGWLFWMSGVIRLWFGVRDVLRSCPSFSLPYN